MRLSLRFESLKATTPLEYLSRFVFGGLVTVLAGLVADRYGPIAGGLFLAFPGIFPASVSLVERHKAQRAAEQGKPGTRSARRQASVEAAGASAGAIGLIAFAAVLWNALPAHPFAWTLLAALILWLAVSTLCWWLRERI